MKEPLDMSGGTFVYTKGSNVLQFIARRVAALEAQREAIQTRLVNETKSKEDAIRTATAVIAGTDLTEIDLFAKACMERIAWINCECSELKAIAHAFAPDLPYKISLNDMLRYTKGLL